MLLLGVAALEVVIIVSITDFVIQSWLFTVAKMRLIQAKYLQDLKEVISRNHGVHESGVSLRSQKG